MSSTRLIYVQIKHLNDSYRNVAEM